MTVPVQRWRSLGHVHVAQGESAAHATHATYPTPLVLEDGRVRVFFSPRDAQRRSSIFSLDLTLSPDGFRVEGPPVGPWLEHGPAGRFDASGASVGWMGRTPEGGLDCWYLGWNTEGPDPIRTAIGRARAAPGAERLVRCGPDPVLGPNEIDRYNVGYPCLFVEGLGSSIWYNASLDGPAGDHGLRRARSADGGSTWLREAEPILLPRPPWGWAVARPTVLRDRAGWHMWYGDSARDTRIYRLGYAHSADGANWTRADEALQFITPEAEWERGSRAYPAVFDHLGRRWMLYNGVGYGRTGFGLAVLED